MAASDLEAGNRGKASVWQFRLEMRGGWLFAPFGSFIH